MPTLPDNGQNSHYASAASQAAENKSTSKILSADGTDPTKSWWFHPEIEAARWNQSYPYQLLIVEAQDGGTYKTTGRSFTLPIAPESLSVSTPFAISTSVTLGGIVEEHNATPLKTISFSGTTGVLPLRGLAERLQLNQLGTIATAIFAGTVTGATRIGNAAVNMVGDFNQNLNSNFKRNLVDNNNFGASPTSIGVTSGYYQFKLLEQFLENYAEIKKSTTNKYRLAFAMWKDQHVYIVTPIAFSLERRAGTPLEYQYSLQLRAWRRVALDSSAAPGPFDGFKPISYSPNALARLNNAIRDARQLLSAVRDTMQAVIQDADRTLYEPLRQLALFAKDHLGVALTMNDLPANVILASKGAIAEWASVAPSFSGFGDVLADHDKQNQDRYRDLVALTEKSGKGETRTGESSQGLFDQTAATSPISSVFDNPLDNSAFFDSIPVGKLKLPPKVSGSILAEREKVRKLTRLDFETMRDNVEAAAANYADAVGMGSAAYNSTYNRPTRVSTKTQTQHDYDVLFALNSVSLELSKLAASSTINPRKQTSVEFVAGLARQSGIAFQIPKSKFSVPFPYGYTLERLSARYLGTPDRWEEIAALNGLRSPYVDEVGFDLPLLVNGRGNTVVVADSSNLYIGQQVWISSSSTSRTVRRITKIEVLSTSQSIITVDGDNDLGRFITLASATLHAFLPDTVNSQMVIYIPSDDPPAEVDLQTKAIPGLNQYDPFLSVGGVDILLTEDNDIAMTQDGDTRLAVGLTNIIQTVRLRLSCPRGGLLGHPEYGFPLQPGVSVADLNAREVAQMLNNLFSDDPTFTGVYGVSVSVNGPVVPITMAVGVRGVDDKIPITVNMQR